jgi:Cu2+-exporting ATPase
MSAGGGVGRTDAEACFHCGLPIPPGVTLQIAYEGRERPVCCRGCLAVAGLILGEGLSAFYQQREGTTGRAAEQDPDALAEEAIFDSPEIARSFLRSSEAGREVTLSIEGIHCAACAWLIERHLRGCPGIVSIDVGLANHRGRLVFDPDHTRLSTVLGEIRSLGYRARPYSPDREEARARDEERSALRRLGVAGLGMAQVMMFAVGLYAGEASGMQPLYRDLLRWVSLLVASVVVVYSARPFFEGAWRDLRLRAPGMDVPVALAIGGAYAASALATLRGTGTVYFDSVCMFTFFLGLGRFLEMRIRHRCDARQRGLLGRLPDVARRIGVDGAPSMVPLQIVEVGDRLEVRPGETIPADGQVEEGESSADESILTGEAAPRRKGPGSELIGGSLNIWGPLVTRVGRTGAESTLARIQALLERAQLEKPGAVRMADRMARYFVMAVIVASAGVGAVWWRIAPDDAFWIVLSVLVVTCPCALSLATPAAVAAASNALAEAGFLVGRGHVLESLAGATHVVFDKTGTLTESRLELVRVVALGEQSEAEAVALARLLESRSEHPIAAAFAELGDATEERVANERFEALRGELHELEAAANAGVAGRVGEHGYRLGRPDWAAAPYLRDPSAKPPELPPGAQSWVLLADERGPIAWFGLASVLRAGAVETLAWLRAGGLSISLQSGDPSESAVREIAEVLGVEEWASGASPAAKVEAAERLQAAGARLVAVGDGVNDAPLLGRAEVSIAMGSGTDLARSSADAVLLTEGLSGLRTAFEQSRRARRVIRQNLGWAVGYNLTVLPLAALGYVAPWLAAIGMSFSSLIVVANALRLGRIREAS